MAAIIASKKVFAQKKEDMLNLVKEVMELANWKDFVFGAQIFIKPNILSNQLVPGQCTSPWVLEGVVKTVREAYPLARIIIGDTDVATTRQVEKAADVWGVYDICNKYYASFVNLSKDQTVSVKVNGKIFESINVPKSIYDSNSMITVPVSKTHTVTVITGALKNQWGCIPRFRHQFHDVTEWAIPEINAAVRPEFVVVDSTISMEDSGPRTGIPKITDMIFASNDLVAMDAALSQFMGINVESVKYIKNAQSIGLGTMSYKNIGDKIEINQFALPNIKKTPFVYLEMKFRKIPGLRKLLFNTPLFHVFAFITTFYNNHVWYYFKGRNYSLEILNHPLYKQEFEPLMKRGRIHK